MTATSQRREEQIAAFYSDHAERLQRAVRRRVQRVGDEVIEDACQITWVTLLRRPDIPLDAHGLSWLSTVAVHEAWRLGSITREQPAGTLTTPTDPNADPSELPEPCDTDRRRPRRARTRPHRAPRPPPGHPRAQAARARS